MTGSLEEPVRARITKIESGRHGRYAICATDNPIQGSVTFALTPDVWSESDDPEPSDIVYLSKLKDTTGGKRAMCACRKA